MNRRSLKQPGKCTGEYSARTCAETDCVRESTRALIAEARTVSVSAISIAELACLQERRRIELPSHWKPWFRLAVEENGWSILPISSVVMEEAYSLPGEFHADPADRILVATARLEKQILLTTDRKLLEYPHVNAKW